jgi:sec-independent protein translocase protein TatA
VERPAAVPQEVANMLAVILGPLFIGGLGVPELLVLLAILVLLFGASKLPQIGRGLGEGIRNFKSGLKTTEDEGAEQIEEGQPPKTPK